MKKLFFLLMLFGFYSASAQGILIGLQSEAFLEGSEIVTDTSIASRLEKLERTLGEQQLKLKQVQQENSELKQKLALLSVQSAKKEKKKFTVSRVGSKQWVRENSEKKKPIDDSVQWDSLRR